MTPLSLDLFTGAVHDVERTQYQILAGLKRAQDAFESNRIYPYLGRLVKLYRSLTTVLERSEQFRTPETGRLKGVDLENETLQYEWPNFDGDQMEVIKDLIHWALPRVKQAIEDGRAVYEYVEENVEVETVGIVPSYVQEGYLMVPDRESSRLHVLRYTLSVFRDDGERYRSLRTEHCKTLTQQGVDRAPSSIKLQLVEERGDDLPNPATYFFQTDLEFPYEETLLPVVKRRFIRHVSDEMGEA
jgi:hypothetical protein